MKTLRRVNKARDVSSYDGKKVVVVPLPVWLEVELQDEVRRLRQLGVPDKSLTYPQLLIVSFQYYRQRCKIVDDAGIDPWDSWLSKLND